MRACAERGCDRDPHLGGERCYYHGKLSAGLLADGGPGWPATPRRAPGAVPREVRREAKARTSGAVTAGVAARRERVLRAVADLVPDNPEGVGITQVATELHESVKRTRHDLVRLVADGRLVERRRDDGVWTRYLPTG